MRRLINILAVIIGTASGLAGLAGAGIVCAAVYALFKPGTVTPQDLTGWAVLGIGAGITFLGFLIASRALLHLRHPDAGTARDMIGTGIYLLFFLGIVPFFKSPLVFPILFGLYFCRRYITKRIAPRFAAAQ